MSLTEPLFFDNDCLSAFLWVNYESILVKLYPGRIVIPSQVYTELSNPSVKGLKAQVDTLVKGGQAAVKSINVPSAEYSLFSKLTQNPDPGYCVIGHGEAAAIVMAKEQGGILASNNRRDISDYVREFSLKHITTGAIMKEAMAASLIDEAQGNVIWQKMIIKRRWLVYPTFSEYLRNNP